MEDDDVLPEPVADDRPSTPAAAVVGIVAVLLLLSGLLAALLVARDDHRTPAERVAAASGAAEEAKTFAFELTVGVAGASDPPGVQLHGVVDADHRRSEIAGTGLAAGGSIVVDGTVLYVPVPPGSSIARGKPFLKFDLAGIQQRLGFSPGAATTVSPLEALQQLRAVDAAVEEVGHEEVRGVSTTHERTTLDLTRMPGFPTSPPPELQAVLDQLRHVPYDVWLDDQDRPRRLTTTFSLVTTTMELFDYGKPVAVDVPSADQVFDGGGDLSTLLPTSPTTTP